MWDVSVPLFLSGLSHCYLFSLPETYCSLCANYQKTPQLTDFSRPTANRKTITVNSVFECPFSWGDRSSEEEEKYLNVSSDIVMFCKTIVNYGSTSITKAKAYYFKETCGFLKHMTAFIKHNTRFDTVTVML